MGKALFASRLFASWVLISFISIGAASLALPHSVCAAGKKAVATKSRGGTTAKKKAVTAKKPAARVAKKAAPSKRKHSARGARRGATTRAAKVARKQPQPRLPEIGHHEILNIAARHIGTPYRRGGSSDRGVDCSGLVRSVFGEVGLDLPHSARAQYTMGQRIDAGDLEPGDLVFFRTRRGGASHVGIYAGERLFIHAAYRGREVRVDSLDDHYYRTRYLGARRLGV